MNETVRVVPTNAALAGQQSFGISGQCVNRNTSDPDVSRFAIKVLAVLGCFLLPCVVAGGAESTIDIHRLTEVIPDFLQQGHKLKVSIRFRGREMAHTSLGLDVHKRFAEALEGKAVIDKQPKLEGRSMMMFMSPVPNK